MAGRQRLTSGNRANEGSADSVVKHQVLTEHISRKQHNHHTFFTDELMPSVII
jgi:hypothetical protein